MVSSTDLVIVMLGSITVTGALALVEVWSKVAPADVGGGLAVLSQAMWAELVRVAPALAAATSATRAV